MKLLRRSWPNLGQKQRLWRSDFNSKIASAKESVWSEKRSGWHRRLGYRRNLKKWRGICVWELHHPMAPITLLLSLMFNIVEHFNICEVFKTIIYIYI
ncbi:hypothetical protein LguiB_005323 [Lonicera macranthoides]